MTALDWSRTKATVAASATEVGDERVPRGWTAALLDHDRGMVLTWPGADVQRGPDTTVVVRIPIGSDHRGQFLIDVTLVEDGTRIGVLDLRCAHAFQIHQLDVPAAAVASVLTHGIRLRHCSADSEPTVILTGRNDGRTTACQPHLLVSHPNPRQGSDRWPALLSAVTSLDSLQPFGWLEGCVLEGIEALAGTVDETQREPALRDHLAEYVRPDGVLDHVDLHGRRRVDELGTIEALLPFAVLSAQPGGERWRHLAREFINSRGERATDGGDITAEGMYTAAHPLAVIGAAESDRATIDRAIAEADLRITTLADENGLVPRTRPCPFGGMYRNWARGHAWYLLGLAKLIRTLRATGYDLADDLPRLEQAWTVTAEWLLRHQGTDGLWACYVDDPVTGPETSGSAGIAAGLAIGTTLGLIDARTEVSAALAGLVPYIDPDGLLGGVSQHNAGGEGLQRYGYRVRSQMGMGLAAQAYGEAAAMAAR